MKSRILTIFLILIFSYSQSQKVIEDPNIISQVLYELEKRNWFPEDVYPLMPPPPKSRNYFIELRDDLTPDHADSLFTRIERRYEKNRKEIEKRRIDSSYIYLVTDNYLFGSQCKWCGIKPDTLLKYESYSRYKKLIKKLIKGKLGDLTISLNELYYLGKYKLKSYDEFPSRKSIYNGQLNFLCGGEISFSRFYKNKELGLIYFSMSNCEMDCGAGYLILFERRNNGWHIFDILMQWIS